MQELVILIQQRLRSVDHLRQKLKQIKIHVSQYIRFQFQQTLRQEKEKRILINFKQPDRQQPLSQYSHMLLSTLWHTYSPFMDKYFSNRQTLLPQQFNTNVLQELGNASRKIVEEIRLQIAKINPDLWTINLAVNTSLNNFENYIHLYRQRTGLSEDLSQFNQPIPQSIEEFLLDSNRSNNKILAATKKYAQQYRSYLQKVSKRKMKTVITQSSKSKPAQSIQVNLIQPIKLSSPGKISLFSNSSIKKAGVQKTTKIPLPPAQKKIQFPHIYSASTKAVDQGPFLKVIRKQSTRRVATLPTDQIIKPSFKQELNYSSKKNYESPARVKNFIESQLETIKFAALKHKHRQRPNSKRERLKMQNTFCFDDSELKLGYQRLINSDKGSS